MQVKTGTSVHLALEGLQLVDLAFRLTVGPRLAKGCQDRMPVGVQTPVEGCGKAAFGLVQPIFEIVVPPVSDHVGEALGQSTGGGKSRNGGSGPGHGGDVGPREMIARRRHHAGNPALRPVPPVPDETRAPGPLFSAIPVQELGRVAG